MTGAQHAGLAAGRWRELPLVAQLGNVGGEVSRAARWRMKDPAQSDRAMVRALELLDLTLADPRWSRRLKELARARELLCDAWLGGREYRSKLEDMDRYFFQFALAARK
ncbi:MAG: hypothetical protein HKL90_03875 [Elusimicrobia bacterium]|nr:hypothetical protein [Elusimicrobiota bacterium]